MNKKIYSLFITLLIIVMATSPVAAKGAIKLSGVTFSLGSLITEGFLQGTDQTTVTVVLKATGTCTIDEETVSVSAMGSQVLWGSEESDTKNNNRPFHVETNNPEGCSNDPEAQDGFVFWTKSSISVFSGVVDINPCDSESCEGLLRATAETNNTLLVNQDYNCKTNQDANTVSCTPIKNNGSNNGAVAICHATGSKNNPYVLITVNVNGLNGHGKHAGDIIPAPANGCPK